MSIALTDTPEGQKLLQEYQRWLKDPTHEHEHEHEQFANTCHEPSTGRFCETPSGDEGTPQDEADEFDRVAQLEKHYGRKEMAPEMGGVQWAFDGGSPPITEAAEDVLQGYPYDHYDRFLSYDRNAHEAAESILSTLQDESSDVTLYSGHRRDRGMVDAILADGSLAFPLVAASPDKDLADDYAGSKRDNPTSVSVVYEFPPGSQAGFYRFNEHIVTGEYEIASHEWFDEHVIDIKLRQVKRSTVPPKVYPEDEEEG